VTRGISFLLMSLVASSSTPHKPSPSLLAYPSGLAIVNCLLALIVLSSLLCRAVPVPVPQVLSSSQCSRVESSPSRRAALNSKVERIFPPPKPLCLRALHTLLPETRLTYKYSTVQSTRVPDMRISVAREEVQAAGMRRDVFGARGAGFAFLFVRAFVLGCR